MEASTLYLVMSVVGGLGLFAVYLLLRRVRYWPFPVRTTEFHIERDADVSERAAARGPSGKERDVEAEAIDRSEESLWGRVKRGLYTYQKRPEKVR